MINRTGAQRTHQVLLLAACLALLTTALAVVPARAASSVDLQARALMGGRYEVGGWAAVAVTLVNDGEPTEGDLSAATNGGTVQRFVEMPSGARKVVMLYVQPEAFQRRITVRYADRNGTAEAEVEIRVLEQSASQLAIIGDGAGTLRPQIAGALDETAPEPITLGPADLPERPEPLEGLSAIVWAADSSGLSEGQRRSLERWVGGGGELIMVGGADWQARTAAFTNMLPISSLTTIDGVAQASLAAWAGSPTPAVATDTVSSGALVDGARPLISAEDGTILLSMRAFGGGRTILLGTDFATEPYRGWVGSPRIWTRVVPTTPSYEQFFGGGIPAKEDAQNAMTQALSNLPSLEVPPAELLLAVIVGYILLIGPISYLVLRRLDRREMAWITAPILIVVFTAGSFGIGSALKGSDVITNQISLIHTSAAGSAATVESYAGIFSPQRAAYDLRVEADALMAALRPAGFGPVQPQATVAVEQGNPARLHDLAINVFGFEGVRADAIIDYEPNLQVSWRRDGGDLVGTVTNTGTVAVTDVAYISSSIGEKVGDLAPGQEAEVRVPSTNFNGSAASEQVYGFGGFGVSDPRERVIAIRRQVIDALVGYGGMGPLGDIPGGGGRGPYLIGWRADDGPLPVLVDGLSAQQYTASAEVLRIRPPLATGETVIRPAQMSIAVVATEGDANSGGSGMIMLGEGSVTFSVTLPLEAANLVPSELTVIVGPDPGVVFTDQGAGGGGFWPPGLIAEVLDPRTGEWRQLGDINQDPTFEIEEPESAISPSGRIEVRITSPAIDPNLVATSVFVSAEVAGVLDE